MNGFVPHSLPPVKVLGEESSTMNKSLFPGEGALERYNEGAGQPASHVGKASGNAAGTVESFSRMFRRAGRCWGDKARPARMARVTEDAAGLLVLCRS